MRKPAVLTHVASRRDFALSRLSYRLSTWHVPTTVIRHTSCMFGVLIRSGKPSRRQRERELLRNRPKVARRCRTGRRTCAYRPVGCATLFATRHLTVGYRPYTATTVDCRSHVAGLISASSECLAEGLNHDVSFVLDHRGTGHISYHGNLLHRPDAGRSRSLVIKSGCLEKL